MRYLLSVPPFTDPGTVVALARTAEANSWDGFFLWDHLRWDDQRDVHDPWVLLGAIAGACIAYSMIYFCNVIDFPINIGGRPLHGPPANIPITFELAILLAGGSSFFGFFTLAKLPQPYHPVFESEDFARAAVDAYYLSVELPPEGEVEKVFAEVQTAGALSAELVTESER